MARLPQFKLRMPAPRCARAAAMLMVAVCAISLPAEPPSEPMPKEANAQPSVIIPAQQTGFVPPGPTQQLQRIAGTTLHFIDSNHLLFTFHKTALLKRSADAQPDDDDHLIHAELVNLATRRIEAASDWLMHDRDRFLWPLPRGRFLVRQRDTLSRTDASLQLESYVRFPGRLRSVQLSPDGKIAVTESEETAALRTPDSESPLNGSHAEAADTTSPDRNDDGRPFTVRILQLDTKAVIAWTRTRIATKLPATDTGILELLRGSAGRWLIEYKGFDKNQRQIAEIASFCSPNLDLLSPSVALIGSCDHASSGRLLTAVNLDGKILWDRKTDARRIWPSLAYSEDGSRFALETLVLNHPLSANAPFDREDILGQVVEVFDTVGGQPILTAPASPILDAGQNFALSPDGRRFAVLHNDAIEVYDLK